MNAQLELMAFRLYQALEGDKGWYSTSFQRRQRYRNAALSLMGNGEQALEQAVEQPVEPPESANKPAEQNNSVPVDGTLDDIKSAILRLQNENERLTKRVASLEALTRPIGDAKVHMEHIEGVVRGVGDAVGDIARKKGYW